LAKATGPAKFLDGHARVSLFEEANDLLIGKSRLYYSRYSPKLADFVPSLWYGREGAGQVFFFKPYHPGQHGDAHSVIFAAPLIKGGGYALFCGKYQERQNHITS
jgi:hypothetical protein